MAADRLIMMKQQNSDNSCVAKTYRRKEMLFCDRFYDDFVTLSRRRLDTSYMFVSAILVYLLYGSAGIGYEFTDLEAVMMISREFLLVALLVPTGRTIPAGLLMVSSACLVRYYLCESILNQNLGKDTHRTTAKATE
ncbi:hypothetical protein Tco_0599818 [Tanacetum coccineum]